MMRSILQALKRNFPRVHGLYSKGRRMARTEFKVLRQVGVRSILDGSLRRSTPWREILPMQKPQRIVIDGMNFVTVDALIADLDASKLAYSPGGNTVYLPPATVDATALNVLRAYYPEDAGLKLVRDPGGIENSSYLTGINRSVINKKLVSSHGHLALAANMLFLEDLGSRLYDLVELAVGGTVWTAYVVQHVDGRPPTMEECKEGIARIQSLERTGVFQITVPGGYEHRDFTCPSCNDNAWMTDEGKFQYVDFQNFVLSKFDTYLRGLAEKAGRDTHFGDESLLWRGRFLYQSVPGLRLPSRRSVDQRIVVIEQLMENAGVRLDDRLVLDIGCNIGMVMAKYLRKGAKWCHGWDMPPMTHHAERLLLAIGCTRFSLTGGEIHKDQRLQDDLPEFIKPSLDGCVVSYLAVRAHMGWLDALAQIPWSYLVYEGHQGDDFDTDMAEFAKQVDFEIMQTTRYADGLSDERDVAILARRA